MQLTEKKKLIRIIVEYMKNRNENDIKEKIGRTKENVWMKFCFSTFGVHDYVKALNIYNMWLRNTGNFQNEIKNMLKKEMEEIEFVDDEMDNENEINMEIEENSLLNEPTSRNKHECAISYSINEWNSYKNLTKSIRDRFSADFACSLSDKLQKQSSNFNCRLLRIYNWFKKENSRKKNAPYWSALYKCREQNCKISFKAFVQKEPTNFDRTVVVNIEWFDECLHQKILKKQRICGLNRINLRNELLCKGSANLLSENIIENHFNKNIPLIDPSVLKSIKYQTQHRFRICNDYCVDSEAAKKIFDSMHVLKNDYFKGYIQEINQNPFGLILFAEIQLKMWLNILQTNPIWYFDSTGSVLKTITGQKKIYLYSLVAHDIERKVIIPIYDFVTTQHNTTNISRYLFYLKKNLQLYAKNERHICAPFIVTDNSWALINSAIETFNGFTFKQYLVICYEIFITNRDSANNSHLEQISILIKTRVVLCATHFLKSMIKKIDHIKNLDAKIRKLFILCFTILQNSTNIKEFEDNLLDVYNIFNIRIYNESVKNSFEKIKFIIQNRKSTNLLQFDNAKQCDGEDSIYVVDDISLMNYKKESPFTSYFAKLIFSFSLIENNNLFAIQNSYYFPKAFDIIRDILYILPLWSGMFLGYFQTAYSVLKTRLTNNPVENWFNQLKNNILQKKDVMPSELTAKLHNKITATFLKYYEKFDIIDSKLNKEMKKEPEEQWGEKSQTQRIKGIYYSNDHYFFKWKPDHIESKYGDVKKKSIIDIIKNNIPKNGSILKKKSQSISISNTCSIDYFIMVLWIIQNNEFINLKKQIPCYKLQNVITNIIEYVNQKKWAQARLEWIESNNIPIAKKQLNSNTIEYNCFLSEYDSYVWAYSKMQMFTWKSKCSNLNCKENKEQKYESSVFMLRANCENKLDLFSKFFFEKSSVCSNNIQSETIEIEPDQKKKCHGIKETSAPIFLNDFPILLVISIDAKECDCKNIPPIIMLREKRYALVGFTLFLPNRHHFILKIICENDFYDIDNLADFTDIKNNSNVYKGVVCSFGQVFYQLQQ